MDTDTSSTAPASSTEVPQPSGQTPKKGGSKLMKLILLGVGGFVILIAGLVVFLFMFTKGASEAAEQVIDDLRAGNCAVIYTDQTTAAFRSQGDQALWESECSRIGAILNGNVDQEGVSVEGESGQSSTAVVEYAINGSDDIVYDVTISLEKVDGEWKMDTFNSVGRTSNSQQ